MGVASVYGVDGETIRELRDLPTAAGGTLAAGLFLYFVDLPSFTPLYDRQPAIEYVLNEGSQTLARTERLNRYFIIFDTKLPPQLRDRSAYFTAMYRIGFEIVLLLEIAAVLAWSKYVWASPPEVEIPLGFFLIHVATVLLVASVRFVASGARARRDSAEFGHALNERNRRRAWRHLHRDGAWAIVLGMLVTAAAVWWDVNTLHVVATSFPLLVWVRKLLFGVPADEDARLSWRDWLRAYGLSGKPPEQHVQQQRRRRDQLAPEISCLLAGAATATVMSGVTKFEELRVEGFPDSVSGWFCAGIIVLLLIAFKGHESRFLATAYEQEAWLKMNRSQIREELGS